MKLLHQKLLLTATALLFISSLTAQDEVLRHIPARTSQIVQVDLQRLQQFMQWEEILQLPAMKTLSERKTLGKESGEGFFEYLENPSVTGIDLGSSLYIFSHRSFQNYADAFTGVAGKIKDLQQFTAWVLKINKTIALTKPGRVKTFIKDNVAFVWDTENFVVVNDIMSAFNRTSAPMDTAVLNSIKPLPGDTVPEVYRSFMKLFGKPPGEPVAEEVIKSFNEDAAMPAFDNRMLALFRQTEPLKAWNYNSIPGKLAALFNPMQLLTNAKGTEEKPVFITSASVLNFDNGRAFYLSRTYFDEQLDKFFSGTNKQPFDVSMIQNVGLQKLVGFLTLKVNMRSLGELFADVMAKEEDGPFEKMRKNGMNPADLLTAFTGDVFIGCTHPGREREDVPPSLVAALKINDLAAAERVLNKWKEPGEESKRKKNEWYGMDEAKTMLIISTSKENAGSFLSKSTGATNDKELEEQVKANPFYLQLNVNELYNVMMSLERPKKEQEKMLADLLSNVQQFKITAGKYESGALLLDYELAFNNKEDNGFRQMMLMYDKLFRSMISNFSERETMEIQREVIIDSALQKTDIPMPPPPPPPPPPAMIEEMKIGTIDQEGVKEEVVTAVPVKRTHQKTKIKIVSKEKAEKIMKTNKKNQ